MNIEVNFENLTEEEQEQFNALVEKANKSKNRVWKPEKNEHYYCIEGNIISEYAYINDYDRRNIVIGNCFKTREEAEFIRKRFELITEMKRYIFEHDDVELDWDNTLQEKWYIRYHRDTDIMDIDYSIRNQIVDNSLYASSSEILEDMIEAIGPDRIKRYYFGVE